MAIVPDNAVEMHPDDAAGLGLAQGDRVRLASASNPEGVAGRLELTRMVRPGCVAVSFHFGHTQFGGTALAVKDAATVFLGGSAVADGDRLVPRQAYRAGINPNDVARLDPALGNTPLTDAVAGIPDFSSTRVRVVKETA
jgi:tetrathionate reductase subunit A